MNYTKTIPAKFIGRPNIFIAYVEIEGKEETVHVKNTGRCRELLVPGCQVILAVEDNPNRKTKYDLVAVYKSGLGLVNMDSQAPNAVVGEYLSRQKEITFVKPEYKFGDSRIDFYFEKGDIRCLMEVKGVTLEKEGLAYFPDAPTQRGTKHLRELIKAKEAGYESYLAFVVQMENIYDVFPARDMDPEFSKAYDDAVSAGVKVLVLPCNVWEHGLTIRDGY